jgi:hypothetical protein
MYGRGELLPNSVGEPMRVVLKIRPCRVSQFDDDDMIIAPSDLLGYALASQASSRVGSSKEVMKFVQERQNDDSCDGTGRPQLGASPILCREWLPHCVSGEILLNTESRMGRYANGSNTILSMVLFLCTANLCLKIHTRAQLGSIWTGEPSAQILAN